MHDRLTAVAFDLDVASLRSLQKALPEWDIALFRGATTAFLTDSWDPGIVDLLVVQASADATKTLELCRWLGRCNVVAHESEKATANILGPRGSLQTRAQRAHAPLLVLVSPGQEELVKSVLEVGAHSCLMLPINAKEVASMLMHARAGNRPGRHTDNLEGAQGEDQWRDDGGQG